MAGVKLCQRRGGEKSNMGNLVGGVADVVLLVIAVGKGKKKTSEYRVQQRRGGVGGGREKGQK